MESLLLIILGAISLGFSLIFLLALSERKKKNSSSPPRGGGMNRVQFEKACVMVLEGMKLEIEEVTQSPGAQTDIIARNPTPFTGGSYLVRCLFVDREEVVGVNPILELSNMVLQERLSKGIFMTTGRFTTEIPTIGELAPMEFIDGPTFLSLVEKYRPDYRVILS